MLKDDKEESTVKVFVWPDGSWRYACDIDELISHGGYTDDFAVLSVNLDVVDTDEGMDALVFDFLKMHKGASANKGLWVGSGGMSKEAFDLFQKIPITPRKRCPEGCPDKGFAVFQKVNLNPGDVVIVTAKNGVELPFTIEELFKIFPNNDVIIKPSDIEIEVISPTGDETK